MLVSFKTPTRETLVASTNRLLRFEFPPTRDLKTYERLIKTHVISAGLSKKTLDNLPLPSLERMYHQLWQQFLSADVAPEDTLLSLCILSEELAEFIPERLVAEDIRALGIREPGTVHSYYYQDMLPPANMSHFLSQHGYRADLIDTAETETLLPLQYLACRRLSHPLPWNALLDSLTAAEAKKFSRLHRFKQLRQVLRQQSWYQKALQKDTLDASALTTLTEAFQQVTHSAEVQAISADCQVIAPVKTLVLVEGETERLLLPIFAKAAGSDFQTLGIEIWPAGGKNYVPTLYQETARNLKIPIVIVLDSDADRIAAELQPLLRAGDALFQIEEGEFEDTYNEALMLKVINQMYHPYPELTSQRFHELASDNQASGRVQALKSVWQAHNLGSFDKIAFAEQYAEQFQTQVTSLSPTILKLLDCILQSHQHQTLAE